MNILKMQGLQIFEFLGVAPTLQKTILSLCQSAITLNFSFMKLAMCNIVVICN